MLHCVLCAVQINTAVLLLLYTELCVQQSTYSTVGENPAVYTILFQKRLAKEYVPYNIELAVYSSAYLQYYNTATLYMPCDVRQCPITVAARECVAQKEIPQKSEG
jgi:hypothetical protein